MTTQQQAYIEGFVKRAAEYGFNEDEAVNILKEAGALTTIAKMEASGANPKVLKRILSSRKQLADEIRHSRNSAAQWNKSDKMQEALRRPSKDFLQQEGHSSLNELNEEVRSAMDNIYHASPKNVRGQHQNVLSPDLIREAMARLRPSRDLPERIFNNIEGKLS